MVMKTTSKIRYFAIKKVTGKKGILCHDADDSPISDIKIIPGPFLSDGRQIVKAEIPKYLIKDMSDATDIQDPITQAGMNALGIKKQFAGRTREDVLKKFPELSGEIKIGADEQGNDIMTPKFPEKIWSFEQ